MIVRNKISLLCLFCYLSCSSVYADSKELNPYTFELYVGQKGDYFDVYDYSLNDSDLVVGSFVSDDDFSLSFRLSSPLHYFKDRPDGYMWSYNFRNFDFNRQTTGGQDQAENLGTSVDGYNVNAFWTYFYNYGDKYIINERSQSFKIGVGAGIGYLKADGNIVLTEVGGMPVSNIGVNDFGYVISVYFNYRYGPWSIRMDLYDTFVGDYSYGVGPIVFGYSFRI